MSQFLLQRGLPLHSGRDTTGANRVSSESFYYNVRDKGRFFAVSLLPVKFDGDDLRRDRRIGGLNIFHFGRLVFKIGARVQFFRGFES